MAETMIRASGGFSKQNVDDAYNTGYNNGIAEAKRGNTAEANHVLEGKLFTTYDAIRAEGRMPNRGATNIVVPNRLSNPNNPTKIPAGYHNGNGEVTVAAPSGTKTLAANQISNVDLTPYDYKYVDASAVYAAGRADWQNHANRSTVYYQEWDDEEGGWSVDQTMTVSKAGIVMILIDAIKFTSTSGYTPGLTGISITGGTILYSSTISDEHKPQSSAPERAYGETYRCYVRMAAAGNIRLMFRLGRRCSGTWLADLIAI